MDRGWALIQGWAVIPINTVKSLSRFSPDISESNP